MPPYVLKRGNDVAEQQLLDFFAEAYFGRSEKILFLQNHYVWLYRGRQNILLVIDEASGDIAGQCVARPMTLNLAGDLQEAVWWMDLIVLPRFRRQGIQKVMSDAVRTDNMVKLGIANDLANKIHRKVGYHDGTKGVAMYLALQPMETKRQFFGKGINGLAVRLKTLLQMPLVRRRNRAWLAHTPKIARRLAQPDPDTLAAAHHAADYGERVLNERNADYIRWNFFDSPYADKIRVYGIGEPLEVVMVVRDRPYLHGTETRILDVWGAIDNCAYLKALTRLALADALKHGAMQMMTMTSLPMHQAVMESFGFVGKVPRGFVWHSNDAKLFDQIDTLPHYWMLADGDNDEIN